MEIHYKTEGYLKDPSYSAELYSFMKEYEDKFQFIESLNLFVDVVWVERLEYYTKKTRYDYSDDGRELTINSYEMFRNVKGRPEPMTSPFEFYQNLRFLFDLAVKEHKLRMMQNGK